MWCDWNSMGAGGWTMMLVFWGAVIALVVWALRYATPFRSSDRPSALEVLERRFAGGEIDRDEFEARRAVLLDRDRESRR